MRCWRARIPDAHRVRPVPGRVQGPDAALEDFAAAWGDRYPAIVKGVAIALGRVYPVRGIPAWR